MRIFALAGKALALTMVAVKYPLVSAPETLLPPVPARKAAIVMLVASPLVLIVLLKSAGLVMPSCDTAYASRKPGPLVKPVGARVVSGVPSALILNTTLRLLLASTVADLIS